MLYVISAGLIPLCVRSYEGWDHSGCAGTEIVFARSFFRFSDNRFREVLQLPSVGGSRIT